MAETVQTRELEQNVEAADKRTRAAAIFGSTVVVIAMKSADEKFPHLTLTLRRGGKQWYGSGVLWPIGNTMPALSAGIPCGLLPPNIRAAYDVVESSRSKNRNGKAESYAPDATGPCPQMQPEKLPIPGVKNLVAVASGKGGVGKTTVSVNLAIALQRMGAAVGLLDADVYGPNVPLMLGTEEAPQALSERQIVPVEAYGLKMISMGLLSPGDKPMIWRGPMLHSVMQQFLRSVVWDELDYLIIDLPPGTGDVQLSLIQTVPLTGAVLVTTPSVVALADVRKAIEMFRQVNVEVLGIVENMSYLACPHCHERVDVFGSGEGRRVAEAYGIPLLGEIEIDPQIRIGGDSGKPVASLGEDAPSARSVYAMARAVAARVAEVSAVGPSGPRVEIS